MPNEALEICRSFLKDFIRQEVDFSKTDQSLGIPPPPLEKPYAPDAARLDLIAPDKWSTIKKTDVISAIGNRASHRKFEPESLTLEELSFLLWATQGIRKHVNPGRALRTVPSAGARHAFETYLAILNIRDIEPGFYRYLPVEHQLLFEFREEHVARKIVKATLMQKFIGQAPVVFFWTTIPYRMEWRYGLASHKVIALDAGHVCQNLYLACEAIDAGTCAIAAYDQKLVDELLRIDGKEEFTIYLAPVGKISRQQT